MMCLPVIWWSLTPDAKRSLASPSSASHSWPYTPEENQAFEDFGKKLVPVLQEMGIQAEPEIHDTYRIIPG